MLVAAVKPTTFAAGSMVMAPSPVAEPIRRTTTPVSGGTAVSLRPATTEVRGGSSIDGVPVVTEPTTATTPILGAPAVTEPASIPTPVVEELSSGIDKKTVITVAGIIAVALTALAVWYFFIRKK